MKVPSYCACSWESVCYHSKQHTGSLAIGKFLQRMAVLRAAQVRTVS